MFVVVPQTDPPAPDAESCRFSMAQICCQELNSATWRPRSLDRTSDEQPRQPAIRLPSMQITTGCHNRPSLPHATRWPWFQLLVPEHSGQTRYISTYGDRYVPSQLQLGYVLPLHKPIRTMSPATSGRARIPVTSSMRTRQQRPFAPETFDHLRRFLRRNTLSRSSLETDPPEGPR